MTTVRVEMEVTGSPPAVTVIVIEVGFGADQAKDERIAVDESPRTIPAAFAVANTGARHAKKNFDFELISESFTGLKGLREVRITV